jgi:hypothetical protein
MRLHRLFRLAAFSILASLVALGAGCNSGPATGEVKGKVTFKGQPVKEGTVTLIPKAKEGGSSYEAKIGADGSFAIQGGVVVGEYSAQINPLMILVDTDPGKTPPAPMEKPAKDIPQKFRMQGTTTLTVNVKAGKNEEFVLDMKP